MDIVEEKYGDFSPLTLYVAIKYFSIMCGGGYNKQYIIRL